MKKLLTVLAAFSVLAISLLSALQTSATSPNLFANPSAEVASATAPASWSHDKWGKNTIAFNYLGTGHTGSHSVQTVVSSYSTGDAKWYPAAVAVKASTSYAFSDWYQSSVASSVDVVVTNTANKTTYVWQGNLPASSTWQQSNFTFKTPVKAAKVTVFHYIKSVGQLTVDDVSLVDNTVAAPSAPTVSVTAPAANTTVSGTVAVTANAADAVAVSSVQFKLDGTNLGSAVTTAPYSVNWDTTAASNGTHTLSAVATNSSNLSTTSDSVSVTVNNPVIVPPTAPTVSLTSPATNTTVSGTTNVTADASGTTPVTGVQFKLDGANLGSIDTAAPYIVSWDTSTASNGTHTLSAVATNSANLSATSNSVSVTVNNTITPPTNGPNLLSNPSFENSSNGTSPDSWLGSNWGTNTSTFSYLNTGHTGNKSVEVQTTAFTSGAANWYYADIPVTAGKTYQYSNWYKSNVDTEVDAEVVMTDGSVQYYWLGSVFANANWTQFKTTFTPPAGAKSIAVYQILAKVGYIISDDYGLNEYTPVPFNRGIVSVTFDDGWANQYANAVPVLNQLGIKSTFFIISGELNDTPDYMTGLQVQNLFAAGNEIGSHTVTHPDLTTLSATKLQNEMANSQTTLQNLLGAPVTDFAYPYGAYNANTIAVGQQYYASQRTVNGGLNTKDNLAVTQLKIYEVDSNISQATVQGWIDAAAAQHAWLILVYHEIAVTPSAPGDELYTTQPSDFAAEMNYLKNSGVATETIHQALTEVQAQ